MPPVEYRILAINPGSTSTKFGVFAGSQAVLVRNLRHSEGEMAPFRGRPVLDQEEFRREAVERELVAAGEDPSGFHAVAGRGGLLGPVRSGTYRVNQAMLDHLREARRGEHASNLGAVLARAVAARAGVDAFIVDPVSVEEWPELARLSGLGVDRAPVPLARPEHEGSCQEVCAGGRPVVSAVALDRRPPGKRNIHFGARGGPDDRCRQRRQ